MSRPPGLSVIRKLVIHKRSRRPGCQYNVIIICDQTLPMRRRRLAAVARKTSEAVTKTYKARLKPGHRGSAPSESGCRGSDPSGADPDVWPDPEGSDPFRPQRSAANHSRFEKRPTSVAAKLTRFLRPLLGYTDPPATAESRAADAWAMDSPATGT